MVPFLFSAIKTVQTTFRQNKLYSETQGVFTHMVSSLLGARASVLSSGGSSCKLLEWNGAGHGEESPPHRCIRKQSVTHLLSGTRTPIIVRPWTPVRCRDLNKKCPPLAHVLNAWCTAGRIWCLAYTACLPWSFHFVFMELVWKSFPGSSWWDHREEMWKMILGFRSTRASGWVAWSSLYTLPIHALLSSWAQLGCVQTNRTQSELHLFAKACYCWSLSLWELQFHAILLPPGNKLDTSVEQVKSPFSLPLKGTW